MAPLLGSESSHAGGAGVRSFVAVRALPEAEWGRCRVAGTKAAPRPPVRFVTRANLWQRRYFITGVFLWFIGR